MVKEYSYSYKTFFKALTASFEKDMLFTIKTLKKKLIAVISFLL